jgi:enterochelin esterase-like enzyme
MQQGQIVSHRFESEVLKSNPLNDPYVRDVLVYLPPGYSTTASKGYTSVIYLPAFGSFGKAVLNIDPFSETLEARMNRLISEKKCNPMILVLVDCFTKFGGSQYINSTATGMYEDYITNEIVGFVDNKYNISHHAVMGHSSGGYGALVLGMRHPDIFQAIADHSGDSAFEYCYLPDFPKALEAYRRSGGYYSDPRKWFVDFWQKPNKYEDRNDMTALNILAMAAHYSPNPKSPHLGCDFPFDLETGEINQDVWNRWTACDPTRMVAKYQSDLRKLKLVYIDCGSKDEFNINLGCRILHSKLQEMGISHFYEEFEGGHSKISHRYDISLPMISRELDT